MPHHEPSPESQARARELLERYDGAERVARLPLALFIAIAPSADPDHPVFVEVTWEPGVVERPPAGSSLWRAALTNRLAQSPRPDHYDALLRGEIERSLSRFPDLETWWAWLRTGWLAPW